MIKSCKELGSLFSLVVIIGVSGCGGGSDGGTNAGGNESLAHIMPTASAGNDMTVNKHTTVMLDASLSSDSTSYKWEQIDGPAVKLTNSDSMSPQFTPRSAATYIFSLQVSNENGSDTDEVIVVAQDISTVSITSPTSNEAIATAQSSISVSGLAGQYIETVSLSNNTTGINYEGSLDGAGSFAVENIVLQGGDNLFELTAIDTTGATTRDTLLVTYNQNVNFLSSPAFSEESGYIDDDVEIVVSIAIDDNQNIVSDGVKLAELNNDSSILSAEVAILYDDGDVANGDDIAGDGVYSSKFTLNKSEAGIYRYRISADTGVSEYSVPTFFTVLTPLTDQDIQVADEATEAAITNNFPAVGSQFTQTDFEVYKDNIVAELSSLANVVTAVLSDDGNSIVIEFDSGLVHTIDFVYSDSRGGARADKAAGTHSSIVQPKLNYQSSKSTSGVQYVSMMKATAPSTSNAANNAIGSYRALSLSPFKWEFAPNDDSDGAYAKIQNSDTPKFTAGAPIIDYDVTVEHFKNLSNYGIVVLASHGTVVGNKPVILTGEEATPAKQKIYQKDIAAKRLIVGHKVTIAVEDGGILWFDSQEKKDAFVITPSFITKYNSNMPNTLVSLGICSGIHTNGLANAFISAGAGAVVGFTDTVANTYAYNTSNTFMESMIDGKTVKDAINDATNAHGIDDGDDTPAAFVYRGNGSLVLERIGIQNGGFEDNLKYWEQNGGDVRILSKLSSLTPQEGGYFAILSSGLGSVNDSEAIITQQFKVPSDTSLLTLSYNVVSEEPMEYVGSSFDDKFRAVLIDEEGNETELAYETVNTSTWIAITGGQSDGGMFDGGDGTAFHTGWKSVNHQVGSLAGKTVTLKLRVWDVGDSIYDTAAIIDNIFLQ